MMAYSPLAYSWLSVALADVRPNASRAATVNMKRLNFICMCRFNGISVHSTVVPANAGTHNHNYSLLRRAVAPASLSIDSGGYGSRLALRLAGTTGVLHQRELQQQIALDHPKIVVG